MTWAHPRTRAKLAAALIERDGLACAICGRPIDPHAPRGSAAGLSIDHVVPRSRGGGHDLANLRLAHHGCNASRGAGSAPAPSGPPRATTVASWAPIPPPTPSTQPRRRPSRPGLVL